MKSNNLVQSWIYIETKINGKNRQQALDSLNKKLKLNTTHARLNEWMDERRNRGRCLSREMSRYMAGIVLPVVMEDVPRSYVRKLIKQLY